MSSLNDETSPHLVVDEEAALPLVARRRRSGDQQQQQQGAHAATDQDTAATTTNNHDSDNEEWNQKPPPRSAPASHSDETAQSSMTSTEENDETGGSSFCSAARRPSTTAGLLEDDDDDGEAVVAKVAAASEGATASPGTKQKAVEELPSNLEDATTTAAASHDNNGESLEEQQQNQQEGEDLDEQSLSQTTIINNNGNNNNNNNNNDNCTIDVNGNQLVEATLIRDVDEGSHTSYDSRNNHHHDNHFMDDGAASLLLPPPTTILTRDITSGIVTLSSGESMAVVVEAQPVELAADGVPPKIMSRKLMCAVMAVLLVVIVALSVGFVVSANRSQTKHGDNGADGAGNGESNANGTLFTPTPAPSVPQSQQSMSPTVTPIPVLQRLAATAAGNDDDDDDERAGFLRCGVLDGPGLFYFGGDNGDQPLGLDASLCAAVAAAATGDPKKVDYKVYTFATIMPSLLRGEIDIVSAGVTHTMERQVYHAASGSGFAFTVPYLYQGMQLAGVPLYVECGDQGLEDIAACGDIRVCVVERSTHQEKLSSFLPGQQLIAVKSRADLRQGLRNNTCNVIAHEGYNLAESLVREAGYEGEYMVGKTLFSKEPLAMITSTNDPQFSDFANSVLRSLFVAEAYNITQFTADQFDQTIAFGAPYVDMFRHAVAAGGNYGELYDRFLESYSQRQSLNLINYGDENGSGLLYSHPFGSIAEDSQRVPGESMLTAIAGRGVLRCGIRSNRPGFAVVEADGTASGMEVDYCHAIGASIFVGDVSSVELVEIEDDQDGFAQLASGDLDIVTGATGNFLNDVNAPGAGEGFALSQPYFYGEMSNRTVVAGEENLCLATIQEDHSWSSFVYWLAAAIIFAEEEGITQGMSNGMPDVFLFGTDFTLMFQDAILAVGNYGEMYENNLQRYLPRSGRNLLNGNVGPQLYPLPGLINNN